MIQTMSNPNDWLQFYHQNLPNQTLTPSFSESTTVTTTTTTTIATAAATVNSSPPSSSTTNLGPDGRVSKPARRRSRASRRNPTTLLNTDTTNFRAMVQQFTGGSAAVPFAPSSTGLPNLMAFGLGPRPVPPPPPPPMNPTMLQFQQLQQQQQQQQQNLYQLQNQHYNMYRPQTTQGGDDTFFQRLMSNPRPPNSGSVADVDEHGAEGGGFFPSTSS